MALRNGPWGVMLSVIKAHGWGPQVCTSALDNEIHMNAWCMIAMYICHAFELID
uniref:Uncharacterized protein n=1 Tax=Vitis vinifera TaxID=29760 RepID=F6HGE1_VITVI